MKNIFLVCSAGMSTSLLVKKMRDAALNQGLEVTIEAYPEVEAKKHIESADLILLGPQVRYLQKKFQAYKGVTCPVEVIDMMAYGRVDGEKILNDAMTKLSE